MGRLHWKCWSELRETLSSVKVISVTGTDGAIVGIDRWADDMYPVQTAHATTEKVLHLSAIH